MSIKVEEGWVIITPLENQPITLQQRLSKFDQARHSDEVMATTQLDAKQW